MGSDTPSFCPRCSRSNKEGRQFCVGCVEAFISPNQMTRTEMTQYFAALHNWCVLYLDPGKLPSSAKQTCRICKRPREPDAVFCGKCGSFSSGALDREPSSVLYLMMATARLARLQYLSQQGKTLFDYGVRDFRDPLDVRAGLEKQRGLIIESLEHLKEEVLADFRRQEEAKARAEEAIAEHLLDKIEPVMRKIDESDRLEEEKRQSRQGIEEWVRDEVAPAHLKGALAARDHGRRVVQKSMYYGLPLELPDVPWSNWSSLSEGQQAEMLRQHKVIQKWWECGIFLAMVGFGLTSPFVVSSGLLMGLSLLKGLFLAIVLGVVLMAMLNLFFLFFFSPRLTSPLNLTLRFLGPLSLLAGILLSWLMDLNLLPIILTMAVWLFASPWLWMVMRIPVWRIREAIISRLELLPPKPESGQVQT